MRGDDDLSGPRALDVIHVGPLGEQPGGIAQVVNEYTSWSWDRARIHPLTTTARFRDPAAPFRVAATPARILAARLSKRPAVVIAHLSQRGSFLREGCIILAAHAIGAPVGAHIHGSSFAQFAERNPGLVAAVLRHTRIVFTLTDEATAIVRSLGMGQRPPRVVQIYNAVAVPEVLPLKGAEVVFCGAVGRRKGVDVLLDAWKELGRSTNGWTLRLFGPGDIRDVTDGDPPHNVVLEGPVDRAVALAAQDSAQIAVLPSLHEALPMFLLEAMSRRCAVVSTTVGQIAALVGNAGLLVPPGQSADLAAALGSLLSDESLRIRMGLDAQRRVADRYSSDHLRRLLEEEWMAMSDAAWSGGASA